MVFSKYERAAHIVRNAVYGRAPGDFSSDVAIKAQMLYHHPAYRIPYALLCFSSLFITIWEPPSPTTSTQVAVVRAVDFVFLSAVAADLLLQLLYHGPRTALQRGWLRAKLLSWLALMINLIVVVSFPLGSVPYIARVLRPIIIIERLRNVRKIAGNLARAAAKIANVGVLLVLHVLLFGVLGFVLYAGIDDDQCIPFRATDGPICSTFNEAGCHNYFAELGESMMHLFELLTASNFPSIMLPVYKCNTWNALYFVAFMLIGFYLLLNLMLAVAYAEFRDLMQEEVLLKYARMFHGCDAALQELGTPSAHGGRDLVLRRTEWVRFLAVLRPDMDPMAAGYLFDTVDGTGTGEVSRREFRRLVLNYSKIKVARRDSGRSRSSGRSWGALMALAGLQSGTVSTASSPPSASLGATGAARTAAGAAGSATGPDLAPGAASTALFAPAPLDPDDDGEDSDEEEVEVLEVSSQVQVEGRAGGTARASAGVIVYSSGSEVQPHPITALTHGTGTAPGPANSTAGTVVQAQPSVVLNPLSAALSPQGEESTDIAKDRSFRVGLLRGGGDAASATGSDPIAIADRVQSWVGTSTAAATTPAGSASSGTADSYSTPDPNTRVRPALTRAVSTNVMRLDRELAPVGASLPFLDRVADALIAAFYRGFSHSTGMDGYGVRPEEHETAAGRRLDRRMKALPKGVHPGTWRAKGVMALRSPFATAFFDAVVFVNSATILAQLSLETDEPGSLEEPTVLRLRTVQWFMLGVFLLEVGMKIALWGPVNYWMENTLHRLDVVLVGTSLAGAILEGTNLVSRAEGSALAFLRFIRLVRAFRMLPGFGLTVASFGDVLPVLARYAMLLLANLYVFAIIGQEAFVGRLNPLTYPAVADSSYGQSGLYSLNFDSFQSTLVVLFYLLVVNDWPVIMEGLVASFSKRAVINASEAVKAPRAYFIAFWTVTIVLVQNVIVAFLIEAFQAEKTKRETLIQLERDRSMFGHAGTSSTNGKGTQGVDDWKALILNSPVAAAFQPYHLSKARHHLDIYDSLYRDAVREAFPETFGPVRGSVLDSRDAGPGSAAGQAAGAGRVVVASGRNP